MTSPRNAGTIAGTVATLGALGDDLWSSPNHHGAPGERRAAVLHGFKVAFEQNRNFVEAVQIGLNFVSGA